MTEFKKVSETEIDELSGLASRIVKEHYDPILGAEQNDYMIVKFQSADAIREQIRNGYRYYFIKSDGLNAGFIGFYPSGDRMYISKLYVEKSFRRKHLAADSVDFIRSESIKEGLKAIFLNVNRYNDGSIKAYEHMGFSVIKTEDNPIGNGYYMNDYVMEYKIQNNKE